MAVSDAPDVTRFGGPIDGAPERTPSGQAAPLPPCASMA